MPIFFDEALAAMDSTLRAEAEAVCDNDVTCLFDIAATNNLAIGQETLSEITTINNEIEEIGIPIYLLIYYCKHYMHCLAGYFKSSCFILYYSMTCL